MNISKAQTKTAINSDLYQSLVNMASTGSGIHSDIVSLLTLTGKAPNSREATKELKGKVAEAVLVLNVYKAEYIDVLKDDKLAYKAATNASTYARNCMKQVSGYTVKWDRTKKAYVAAIAKASAPKTTTAQAKASAEKKGPINVADIGTPSNDASVMQRLIADNLDQIIASLVNEHGLAKVQESVIATAQQLKAA